MVKVKINNKTYNVPELKIGHYTKMEEQGFSIIDAFQKGQIFLVAMGFTCAVTGLDRNSAEELLNQHVLGGGKIQDISNAFGKAVAESDFFKKMLGLDKKKTNTEETEAEIEEETETNEKESK